MEPMAHIHSPLSGETTMASGARVLPLSQPHVLRMSSLGAPLHNDELVPAAPLLLPSPASPNQSSGGSHVCVSTAASFVASGHGPRGLHGPNGHVTSAPVDGHFPVSDGANWSMDSPGCLLSCADPSASCLHVALPVTARSPSPTPGASFQSVVAPPQLLAAPDACAQQLGGSTRCQPLAPGRVRAWSPDNSCEAAELLLSGHGPGRHTRPNSPERCSEAGLAVQRIVLPAPMPAGVPAVLGPSGCSCASTVCAPPSLASPRSVLSPRGGGSYGAIAPTWQDPRLAPRGPCTLAAPHTPHGQWPAAPIAGAGETPLGSPRQREPVAMRPAPVVRGLPRSASPAMKARGAGVGHTIVSGNAGMTTSSASTADSLQTSAHADHLRCGSRDRLSNTIASNRVLGPPALLASRGLPAVHLPPPGSESRAPGQAWSVRFPHHGAAPTVNGFEGPGAGDEAGCDSASTRTSCCDVDAERDSSPDRAPTQQEVDARLAGLLSRLGLQLDILERHAEQGAS